MDWLRIGLAVVAMSAPSFLAFGLILWVQKRRQAATPDAHSKEKRRAARITGSVGVALIRLVQLAAGLAAVAPAIALGVAISNPASELPVAAHWPKWLALYVGGWAAFGWCIRITDALGHDSRT